MLSEDSYNTHGILKTVGISSSMMDNDILRRVADNELEDVLRALKREWPKHFLLYQYVTIMDEYKKANVKSPQTNLYMYGSYEEGFYLLEGTFLTSEGSLTWYFLYSPAQDLTALPSVLARTKRIPWRDGQPLKNRFQVTVRRFTAAICEAASANGLEKVEEDANFIFWVSPDQPFDYGVIPDDVFLEFLKESDAAKINDAWVHKSPGTGEFLATQIRNNFGLGLYRKSDTKLLAHSISFHSGGIFVLITDPGERKKGYAEIVVRNMVKELRRRGRIPFCTVQCPNLPSQALFRKIGFQEYSKADYISF